LFMLADLCDLIEDAEERWKCSKPFVGQISFRICFD